MSVPKAELLRKPTHQQLQSSFNNVFHFQKSVFLGVCSLANWAITWITHRLALGYSIWPQGRKIQTDLDVLWRWGKEEVTTLSSVM